MACDQSELKGYRTIISVEHSQTTGPGFPQLLDHMSTPICAFSPEVELSAIGLRSGVVAGKERVSLLVVDSALYWE